MRIDGVPQHNSILPSRCSSRFNYRYLQCLYLLSFLYCILILLIILFINLFVILFLLFLILFLLLLILLILLELFIIVLSTFSCNHQLVLYNFVELISSEAFGQHSVFAVLTQPTVNNARITLGRINIKSRGRSLKTRLIRFQARKYI